MLRARRVPGSLQKGIASYVLSHQSPKRGLQRQHRVSHDDRSAKAADTPPRTATPDSLAHQQALFPTEFSEFIRYDGPFHHSSAPELEEEELHDIRELSTTARVDPVSEDIDNKHENRTSQGSPFRRKLDEILSTFLPSHGRRSKVDLSYTNVRWWEVNTQDRDEASNPTFRSTAGLRQILIHYLHNVEPYFHDSHGGEDVLTTLGSTFSEEALNLLQKVGYDVSDVVSWAWIFSAENVEIAFARYVALAEQTRTSGQGRIPKFVPLQLLRAEVIGAYSLKEFIKSILVDLQSCREAKEYYGWNWVTRVCLVVRLLRHARQIAPECFEDISLIVNHLFYDYYVVHPRSLELAELRRLSHIYNRFLSLMSLAPLKSSYNAYLWQQNAQLVLIRLMFALQPPLPLTREGYRALIAVQLLHRKTAQERVWAETKALSWPPWRQIKSGIEQDLEYPGKESRVIRLLRRMQEAGYTLGDWEKSAAILAGWDTDKSPTIQTRAIFMRQRRPWLLSRDRRPWLPSHGHEDDDVDASSDGPEVWAARIRATRTTREAWASFCSYEMSQGNSPAHYLPYFAMLDRLHASKVRRDSTLAWKYLAGDIKEAFEVSENPREVIYVDSEVPSAEEFYQRMLRAGVKPGGHVLPTLLRQSSSIEAGFAYIQDSRWDEVTKDVLRHAEKYPISIIRDSLTKIAIPTLAAFVLLIAKSGPDETMTFRNVGRLDAATGKVIRGDFADVSPLTYASQLLLGAGISDIRVWNALAEGAHTGLAKHMYHSSMVFKSRRWLGLKKALWPEKMHISVHPDMDTFRHQAKILHSMCRYVNTHIAPEDIGSLAKTTFVRAVYGRTMETFLPRPDQSLVIVPKIEDLLLVVRVLVSTHDAKSLVALLKWINEHTKALVQGQIGSGSEPQEKAKNEAETDGRPTQSSVREVLCAIRLFLEGTSEASANFSSAQGDTTNFVSPLSTGPGTVQEAQKHCQKLEWPSDGEVRLFFDHNALWVERVRRAAEMMAQRKAGSKKANDRPARVTMVEPPQGPL